MPSPNTPSKGKAAPKAADFASLVRIVERAQFHLSAEISAWKSAVRQARDPDRPRRWLLHRLYDTTSSDPHLSSAIEKRMMRVSGAAWQLTARDGKEVPTEVAELFGSTWFVDFMEAALSVPAHGPAAVVFRPAPDGGMPRPEVYPREHYVPDLRSVQPDLSAEEIVPLDTPAHAPWVLHLGRPKDLGLLHKAVPMIVFKNAANTAWAEYGDIFGQPIRRATVPQNLTAAQLAELDRQLENMGRSAYIRLPTGVDFELTSATGRSGIEVFEKRVEYCNAELSKLVEGQTMTSDNGSSRSQAEVHQDTANLYRARDKQWLKGVVNEQLMPLLALHGLPVDGVSFGWVEEEGLDFASQLQADQWLEENFEIDVQHFANRYKTPITGRKKPAQPEPTAPAPGSAAQGRRPWPRMAAAVACPSCGGSKAARAEGDPPGLMELRSVLERVAEAIHGGGSPDIPPDLLLGNGNLYETALSGITHGPAWDSPDTAALEMLRADAWQFGGARTEAEAAEIRSLLVDADGNRRSWADFREAVRQVNADYYEPWLRTEYNTAQVSAVAASQWMRIQDEAETFPNLRYETVGDDRVRDSHKALDGITRPVNDSFWDKAFPPNGWNCRCDVSQEDDTADLTPDQDAGAAIDSAAIRPEWQRNVGRDLRVLPGDHPWRDSASPAPGFQDLGLKPSAEFKPRSIRKAADTDLRSWHDGLEEVSGMRQATLLGRPVGVPGSLIDDLEAAGHAWAAAPVVDGLQPDEVWTRRAAASATLSALWWLDGFVLQLKLSITRSGVTASALQLLRHAGADAARSGILSGRRGA